MMSGGAVSQDPLDRGVQMAHDCFMIDQAEQVEREVEEPRFLWMETGSRLHARLRYFVHGGPVAERIEE